MAKKVDIPLEDLEQMTIHELMEKYGVSDSVICRRRRELGAKPVRRTNSPKAAPPELVAKWVELNRQGLTVRVIAERYSGWSRDRIAEEIKAVTGEPLRQGRDFDAGWCAT